MVNVSVIMPCLNGMKYISRCMDSVLSQTLNNIEILVVDAGSTDGTLEVLSKYAEGDPRLRILHSEKKSMGYQYNIGIDSAQGEYIGFCEMDDYVDTDMYKKLYLWAAENNADYIKSDFYMFVTEGDREISHRYQIIPKHCEVLINETISVSDHKDILLTDINMWNGIYKKSFLKENRIRLNETPGAAFQDMGFVLQTNMLGKRAIYRKECFYHYRRDNCGSSTYSTKNIRFVLDELKYIRGIVDEHPALPEFNAFLCTRFRNSFFSKYDAVISDGNNPEYDDIREFQEYLRYTWNSETQQNLIKAGLWYDLPIRMFIDSAEFFDTYQRYRYTIQSDSISSFINELSLWDIVVIVGCGQRGKALFTLLERNNIANLILFADNNVKIQHTKYLGADIIGLNEASEKYPTAAFVVSVANGNVNRSLRDQLRDLGIPDKQIFIGIGIGSHEATEMSKKDGNSNVR